MSLNKIQKYNNRSMFLEHSDCATGCACSAVDDTLNSSHKKGHHHDHDHNHDDQLGVKKIVISAILLVLGLIIDNTPLSSVIPHLVVVFIYVIAYILVGYPILKGAVDEIIKNKDFFNEFSLMGIATIGAMGLGEYPEAIAVMLFYSIGEYYQSKAVGRATRNIQSILDVRVEEANLITTTGIKVVAAENVRIGSKLQVKVGERIPLDGIILSERGSFNTVALTGESVPQTKKKGEPVLAGMINLEGIIEIETTKDYNDTALSKILSLVKDATSRKSKTELMIRKIARIYTPIIFALAVLLTVLPALIVNDYVLSTWLYRSLTFLVISCPCALVVSIPLAYFAGIGAASKAGILFKGANYLDLMSKVNTVVMDKTGTLTEGVFEVQNLEIESNTNKEQFLGILSAVESHSTHPIARAITKFHPSSQEYISKLSEIKELAGYGISCKYGDQEVLVGNSKLLDKFNILYESSIQNVVGTIILVSINGKYSGYVEIADRIKVDAKDAVDDYHKNGIHKVVMLSGDSATITKKVGDELGVDFSVGGLLPDGKVKFIEELKRDSKNVICFVGDGINDAPALALSDVGVAMGGMGSDAAIDIADVVIQTDQPSKLNSAISISKKTRQIVLQNIIFAFGIKLAVLSLGAMGVATMWEAVVADVGVTFVAVLNSIRVLSAK